MRAATPGWIVAGLAALLLATAARAAEVTTAEPPAAEPADETASDEKAGDEKAGTEKAGGKAAKGGDGSLWERDMLTGDWGGFRHTLGDYGLAVTPTYIGETYGIVSGGKQRSSIYGGRLDVTMELDTKTAFDWAGGLAHATVYQQHGSQISACCIGNYTTISSVEARSTTRLYTAWYQQSFLADRASVRLGQLAADDEFITSKVASNFINGTFGWWALTAADLPSGGPGYPLPTPAARLQYLATSELSMLFGAFAGDVSGKLGPGDAQQRNSSGTTFSFDDGVWLITEGQFNRGQEPGSQDAPMAFKVGGWLHTGNRFVDQRYDANGLLLADPASTGQRAQRSGLWGVYAVAEGVLWRPPGPDVGDAGLSAFLRAGLASPQSRVPVSHYIDAGLTYKGLLPDRPDDVIGFATAVVSISGAARAADRDQRALDPSYPLRTNEILFEWTYQVAIADWWSLQPDLQYVMRPAGGVPLAGPGSGRIPDTVVVGARTAIRF